MYINAKERIKAGVCVHSIKIRNPRPWKYDRCSQLRLRTRSEISRLASSSMENLAFHEHVRVATPINVR